MKYKLHKHLKMGWKGGTRKTVYMYEEQGLFKKLKEIMKKALAKLLYPCKVVLHEVE